MKESPTQTPTPASEFDLLMGDAQIVSAGIREDVDKPTREDYFAALRRTEAAGEPGHQLVERQLGIEGMGVMDLSF